MVRQPSSATQDPSAVRMTGLLNASSRSHLGRGANRGSSKCCRTKQPAVVRLFENRNCQFEFISLRHPVLAWRGGVLFSVHKLGDARFRIHHRKVRNRLGRYDRFLALIAWSDEIRQTGLPLLRER